MIYSQDIPFWSETLDTLQNTPVTQRPGQVTKPFQDSVLSDTPHPKDKQNNNNKDNNNNNDNNDDNDDDDDIIIIITTAAIIIITTIIIAYKGAIRYFLQSPHCAANRLQHVRSSGPGAIVCKSRATYRALITCNMSC